ncbi:MAG: nuclear transport factor 2 family protein [Acidimicrobiales bacterium]
MLSDGDHIRNLLGAYCERIDRADHEGVGALFGDDGVLATEDGTELARGASAIAAFYGGMIRLHSGEQRTKHLVSNTVLEEGADGVVVARSSYVVFQATGELPLQPIIAGRYVDRFAQDGDGTWCWIDRRFSTDLVGHLSQHLGQI